MAAIWEVDENLFRVLDIRTKQTLVDIFSILASSVTQPLMTQVTFDPVSELEQKQQSSENGYHPGVIQIQLPCV